MHFIMTAVITFVVIDLIFFCDLTAIFLLLIDDEIVDVALIVSRGILISIPVVAVEPGAEINEETIYRSG